MTSTSSAADTGLPKNVLPFPKVDDRNFLPLDAHLVEMLSAEPWREVGMTCRVALIGFRLGDDDLARSIGELMDDCPDALAEVAVEREKHRKTLQRCLALLRAADRRENKAFDIALSARGF